MSDQLQSGNRNFATVSQAGDGNKADQDQIGDDNFALVDQRGIANMTTQSQVGNGNTAVAYQYGDANYAGVAQAPGFGGAIFGAGAKDVVSNPAGDAYGFSFANDAYQEQTGVFNWAISIQTGAFNDSDQWQDGSSNASLIDQDDVANWAQTEQIGDFNAAQIWQSGDGNYAGAGQYGTSHVSCIEAGRRWKLCTDTSVQLDLFQKDNSFHRTISGREVGFPPPFSVSEAQLFPLSVIVSLLWRYRRKKLHLFICTLYRK